jgi:hypothetical protein
MPIARTVATRPTAASSGRRRQFFLTTTASTDPQAYVTEPACLSAGEPAVIPPAGACATEIANPARTYLGAAQKAWLKSALASSTATWKFIMNGPVITNLTFLPYDRWEGYSAERAEILEFIRNPDGYVMIDDRLTNVVVLTPTSTPPSTTRRWRIRSRRRLDPEIIAGAIGMDPIYRDCRRPSFPS